MPDIDLKAFESQPVIVEKKVEMPSWVLKLKAILAKGITSLTPNDKEIIKARVSYLTETQKVTYSDILEVKELKSEPTYRELQVRAKAKGLKYVGVSKEDLIKLFNN